MSNLYGWCLGPQKWRSSVLSFFSNMKWCQLICPKLGCDWVNPGWAIDLLALVWPSQDFEGFQPWGHEPPRTSCFPSLWVKDTLLLSKAGWFNVDLTSSILVLLPETYMRIFKLIKFFGYVEVLRICFELGPWKLCYLRFYKWFYRYIKLLLET